MNYQKGFTLIEILVVAGIVILIISFGMVTDFSIFKQDIFLTEESTIVSALERARSHAMANMFESAYGVCYDTGSYIIFREKDGHCVNGISSNELIPANTNITITFPTVVFDQLTGKLVPAASGTDAPCLLNEKRISIDYQGKVANVCINNEGRINW